MNLKDYIATIPNFPQEGILFRDITPLMANEAAFQEACKRLCDFAREVKADVILGPESRGFIFGVPVAYNLGKSFVPVRKKGKLPLDTISKEYDLEYGSAVIEMHKDSIKPGQRVLIVDDLIATGGTIQAIIKMIEQLGGQVVRICFVMELAGLKGREKLKGYQVDSVITYEGN